MDAAARATRRQRVKFNSILDYYDRLPSRTRNKFDALIEASLEELGDDIYDMITDRNDPDSNDYRGLDYHRDTEAEIETAIGFFPETLSRENDQGLIPIQCILNTYDTDGNYKCNLKATPFIVTLVRLGNKWNQFEEEQRGGLLVAHEEWNALADLMCSSHSIYGEEHNRIVDNVYLTQLIRLRRGGSLKKEDVYERSLVNNICYDEDYFAGNRFQFLVEWDPSSLTETDVDGCLPLHYAANDSTIQGFRIVFEYMLRYYPNKTGILFLFKKDADGDTPFQLLCNRYPPQQYGELRGMVEDTFTRYGNIAPANAMNALLSSATDENIHLDCVYTLLRRNPVAVLKELLSGRPNNNNNKNDNNINYGDDNYDGDRDLGRKNNYLFPLILPL